MVVMLGGVAILLGIAHNMLFFGQSLGINFFAFTMLVLAGGCIVARRFERKIDTQTLFLILPILFFALMVFVRSSLLLTFFNVIGSILLLFILARSYAGKHLKDFLPWDYLRIFFLPFAFVLPFFRTVLDFFVEIFALRKVSDNHPQAKEILRGTVMAVIALAVFTLLFAGADSAFSHFVHSVFSFDFNIDMEFLGRLLLFLFVSAFFVGAFGYMFKKREEAPAVSTEETRMAGALEMKILLGSINVLFFIFIVLQLAHLFGGGSSIVSEGVTYAEYARKGFFELMLVAIFSYLIIATAEKQIVKNGNAHLRSFKTLSTALIAQVIVILVSAFMRLSLYENAYGFSTIRLYSHALMIWLGIVLILLARHILGGGTRAKFAMQVFACVMLLLISMNLISPDAFIAKRNIERYDATGKIDTKYLASLSDDAVAYTAKLLQSPDPVIRAAFADDLYQSRKDETPISKEGWPSLQISRMRAQKILSSEAITR